MSRRNRRQRQQAHKPQRGSGSGRASRPGGAPAIGLPAAQPGQPSSAGLPSQSQPAKPVQISRPVERARVRPGAAPLPPTDASIPLERVPYFKSDLARLAITAALMFALLIIGSLFIR